MEFLAWRLLGWSGISFLIVVGVIEGNVPADSKFREILLVSLSSTLAGICALVLEVVYQFLKWIYKNKFKKNN